MSVVVSSCYSKATSTLKSVVVGKRKTSFHFDYSRPALKAGAWSPGCSLPGTLGCDEACKNPGRGPGSPPPPEASGPGCAVSQRTDGCDFSLPVRYGSSRRPASGCDVRLVNGLLLCGCCCGFFGPV